MGFQFSRQVEFDLHLADSTDSPAPGGAITKALCGSWDHEGECRWPHHSSIEKTGHETYRLVVRFEAQLNEVDELVRRIEGALKVGQLITPDGKLARWSILTR